MRRLGWLVAALPLVTIFGCEPIDGGGGGGTGGRVAFVRASQLLVSSDDGFGTGEAFLSDLAGNAAEPAFSRSGVNVAFAYSPTGSLDSRGIYLVPSTGGTPTALAEPSGASESFSSPVFTPDDASVVFVREDRATGERTLLKVSTSGGAAEAVASGVKDVNFPAFLDANTLVVLDSTNALQKLDLTTGVLTALGLNATSRPAVQRDGQKIAFAESLSSGIVIADLAATPISKTPLAGSEQGQKPAFSPDGTVVAFELTGKLFQTKADGSSGVEPLQSGTDVAWGL